MIDQHTVFSQQEIALEVFASHVEDSQNSVTVIVQTSASKMGRVPVKGRVSVRVAVDDGQVIVDSNL